MQDTLFRFVFRYSLRQQIIILTMTVLSFPFLYFSLDLPKIIINEAIGGKDFPRNVLGMEFDQVPYLLLLSFIFLALVFINGGFKYFLEIYKGKTGERMLRRLRFQLYDHILRFPLPHFRRVPQGELIPMITGEVESVGGFVGSAVSVPAFYGGTLFVILFFMFMQDLILGLAAISLYPIQAVLIPILQKKLLHYNRRRVREIRRLANVIGESVRGVTDIHANDAGQFFRARISDRLGRIYGIRYKIYRRKFLIKFLNAFLGQLTPFFFFSIGGYLVIKGELTLGALVAILAAYKDLSSPWKELLNYYQHQAAVKVKYEQVVRNFVPARLMPEPPLKGETDGYDRPLGDLKLAGVSLLDDQDIKTLDNVSLDIKDGEHLAITGPETSGKSELSMIMAGLLAPSTGRVTLGGTDCTALPKSVLGRHIGYVGMDPFLFAGTLKDNLYLGLKHEPVGLDDGDEELELLRKQNEFEAAISGNSPFHLSADWIDLQGAGVDSHEALAERAIEVLSRVGMETDLYEMGLRTSGNLDTQSATNERLLAARREVHSRLRDPELSALVEPFDPDVFNNSASVGENILFGASAAGAFEPKALGEDAYMRQVLAKVGLLDTILEKSIEIAELMVELFADIDPGNELFERFSFVGADEIADMTELVNFIHDKGAGKLKEPQKRQLLSLAFQVIPSRHRLDLIDNRLMVKILEARREFAAHLPRQFKDSFEFFDPAKINRWATIQDNILFGKVVYGQPRAKERVGEIIKDVIDSLGLHKTIMRFGFDYHVGPGGAMLNPAQRQKVMLARQLLKRPDTLILNDCLTSLDGAAQAEVIAGIREECRNRRVIACLSQSELAKHFPRVVTMDKGTIVGDAPAYGAVAE
ncbi:MAG: ABC transporter transmembrane domain-containing protein [Alphaproteobacteria bacterium]|nr:ABC transporter transmembrane domain-containing protein [Alphaproteobacteria bacterium]